MNIKGICGSLGFAFGGGGGYWLTQYQDRQTLLHYSYCLCVPMPPPPPSHLWVSSAFYAVLLGGIGLITGSWIAKKFPPRIKKPTIPIEQTTGVWPPAPKA